MSWVYTEKRLKRTETYWSQVQACPHGDWCADCHWVCTSPFFDDDGRPVIYDDERIIKVHESIFLGLFPEGLDKESLLIAECKELQCVSPAHQKRILIYEKNGGHFPVDIPVRKRNKYSQMTEEIVLEIRRLRETGITIKELSKRFNTSTGNIGMIVRRHTWKHI